MAKANPRIPALTDEEMSAEARKIFEPLAVDGRIYNIFRTLANHVQLASRWLDFGTHILRDSTLPAREREIAILRIGWLCQSEYEWGQHVIIGKQTGLTDAEIERIKEGPVAAEWNELDRSILFATDELHSDAVVGDKTWETLKKHFNTQQLMDLVFTVGQYNLVSMALNTFGVELDEGVRGFGGE